MMNTEERLNEIKKDQIKILSTVTELKVAICGSEKIGVEGLIKKVKKHDIYIENEKKVRWLIAGIITLLTSSLAVFWSKIF